MFRRKHTSLSRLYWMSQLGNEAVNKLMDGQPGSSFVTDVIGTSFPRGMLPQKCDEYRNDLAEREGTHRLHLLVICSANFESYLQDIIRLHVGSLGHALQAFALDDVGKALARPVVNSSTVPEMLKYIEQLVTVSFGPHLVQWINAYKLRCAAAHNGGVMTAKVKKDIPSLKAAKGAPITLAWQELMAFLAAADDIATQIDRRVSNGKVRALEARWILEELKQNNALPARHSVWTVMYQEYHISLPKQHKPAIEAAVY
jgi:hypothetical protein